MPMGVYFNGAGPATNWNVFIYANSGVLPGAQVYSTLNQPVTQVGTTFTVNLTPAAVLPAGTYWIEIQANMTFRYAGRMGLDRPHCAVQQPCSLAEPGRWLRSLPDLGAKAGGVHSHRERTGPGVPD